MKIRAHACIVSAFALGIPAAIAFDAKSVPGCGSPCVATISVPGTSCGAGIVVSPDPIIIKSGKAVDIEWRIQGKAWKFSKEPKGIVINWGGDEFKEAAAGDSNFKMNNKASRQSSYKYDINLVSADGKTPCSLDPSIMNY